MAGQLDQARAQAAGDAAALEKLLHGNDTWHVA
jgi:hypothetical protein